MFCFTYIQMCDGTDKGFVVVNQKVSETVHCISTSSIVLYNMAILEDCTSLQM